MLRLPAALVALLALASLAAPPAGAQAATTIAIGDLPDAVATNRSVAVIGFNVTVATARDPCAGQGVVYTVDLAARPQATTGNTSVAAQFIHPRLEFRFPATQSLSGTSVTQGAALEVARGAVLDAVLDSSVALTATIVQRSGCISAPGSSSPDLATDASVAVTFLPGVEGVPKAAESGQAMPGGSAALLAVGLVAVTLLRRRAA